MSKVVVTKNYSDIKDASESCPVGAFKTGPNGELVIDPDTCIDCGSCQSVAPEGTILDDGEADEDSINFNQEKAEEWNK
jgi:ferredoxin